MKTSLRHRFIATLVLAVLAIPATAAAQETFTVTFENLAPGVAQSTSFPHQLSQDAVFRGLTWLEQTGALEFADLEAEVCASDRVCVDGSGDEDTILRAGTLTITVTAVIHNEAPQDTTGTASGLLTFAAPDDAIDGDLPFTGARLLEMTAWGAALISIGALLVAVARRRDSEETAP